MLSLNPLFHAEALDKLYLPSQGSSFHSTLTKVGIALTFAMALLGGSGAAVTGIVMHTPFGVSFWVNLSVGGLNLSVCLSLIVIQVIRAQEEVNNRQILSGMSAEDELPDNPLRGDAPDEAEVRVGPPVKDIPEAELKVDLLIVDVPEAELQIDPPKVDVPKKRIRSKSLSQGLQVGKGRRRVYSLTQKRMESVDLSQAVQPLPQSFHPPKTLILPKLPLYPVNFGILQFVITDFVGGGKGNHLGAAVEFFRHYIYQYTQQFPSAKEALRILGALNSFVKPSLSIPLGEASQQLIQKLKSDGYVAFEGGTYHSDGGHAIFCELFLKENQITLKVTNSGEGLEYHPRVKSTLNTDPHRRNYFYRTLVFSGATSEQLEACQFLPILLSFTRPCSSVVIDPSLPELSEYTDFKMKQIYPLLFYNWPGKMEVGAENPGGAQRANSCSVQSVIKWMKGEFGKETTSYLSMTLWIKMLAFKDYLEHEKHLSFAFIHDAIRRISSQASKMQHAGQLEDPAFDYLQELNRLAQEKGVIASINEADKLHDSALSFPTGIDLSQAEVVSRKEEKSTYNDAQISSMEYQHRFVEDGPDYLQLPLLSQSYIAPLHDEMAYRLNFFRLLPDFDVFDFERDVVQNESPQEYVAQQKYWALKPAQADTWKIKSSLQKDPHFLAYLCVFYTSGYFKWGEVFKEELDMCMSVATVEQIDTFRRILFFNHLSLTCQKFFYTSEEGSFSLHIHDPFFADLLNGWMIVYREAQKIGDIEDEVLLEWMDGLHLLLSTHASEYLFDTRAAQEKFSKVIQYVKKERARLLEKLGSDYKRPKNYWAINDKEWRNGWSPFGVETDELGGGIKQWSDLPAMARFARKKQYKKVEPQHEYLEGVLAFGLKLGRVSYYSYLRESLALFFVLADRHLTCESTARASFNKTKKEKAISIYPHKRSRYTSSLNLFTWFGIQTKRPGVSASPRYFPEHHIPKESKTYAFLNDLNQRIQGCLSKQKGAWPFFTEQEEGEFLAFVQKDPLTRLCECLKFFESRLEKLANPDYQLALESILFGENAEAFERVFLRQESVDLLFSFLDKSSEILLKKGPKTQSAAPFLFQIHLRLCHIASNQTDSQPRLEQLFTVWNSLFEAGKRNPRQGFLIRNT